jgi:putative transposase
MRYDPDIHHRQSIRLQGWDYSTVGIYFLTVCTQNRECLFGEIVGGKMVLSEFGQLVAEEWERSQQLREEIEFDAWVIMPNHFHALVQITNSASQLTEQKQTAMANQSGDRPVMRPKSISSLMAGFKSITTARINTIRQSPGVKVWQRNYYDSIIRDEGGLERVRAYIKNNPQQWEIDRLRRPVPRNR